MVSLIITSVICQRSKNIAGYGAQQRLSANPVFVVHIKANGLLDLKHDQSDGVLNNQGAYTMTDIATSVFTQMIKTMQLAAEELTERLDLAAQDIGDNRINGAIGALADIDERIESLTAMVTAIRVMHRGTPF
ncbi:hypothetical protein KQ944_18095 [Bacillus subtilis]|uniref:hypothetical protein n=1 Tax=Pseudochrobactrum asaccharolyticum TaxID=354351 RepID=UPI001F4608A6|nr:hypothetical protein [Pseudochrobactrum asaccharolyticum]MCF7646909.1 hypothetical protein [Pseudochrobactrum asaccharolyticum]MCF7673551.1 hypothetical protein [Bacillus subtilis]